MKGQISLEAIMIAGLAVLVVTSLVTLMSERYSSAMVVGESGEAKLCAELIAEAINSVHSNGEGFSIHLPDEKLNFSYLSSRGISFEIDGESCNIVAKKNTSMVGGDIWEARIPIVYANFSLLSPTSEYPELTVRNNGTHILIYAEEEHIKLGG